MATIIDVAREAGVSRSTVSRVLNNQREVDVRTAKRVWEAIQKLDYHPNASARALAKQKTETIGVMLAHVADPFYEQIIRGIDFAATQKKHSVAYFNSYDALVDHKEIVAATLNGSRVDGIVIVGSYLGDRKTVLDIIDRGLPIALIERHFSNPSVPCVVCNNRGGAAMAVRYLVSLGHTRIGCITGNLHFQSAIDRLAGYKDALVEEGLDSTEELIVFGDFQNQSGYEGLIQLMSLENPPTAVFASNDMMAIGAMRAASELGIEIPRDISIIGFDDITFATMVYPELTTMRQPLFEMGALATESLINRVTCAKDGLGDNHQVVKEVLEPTLVVRKSCAKPRS